jgi:hypothetical protein
MPDHFDIGVPPLPGGAGMADISPLETREGATGDGRAFFVFHVPNQKDRRS